MGLAYSTIFHRLNGLDASKILVLGLEGGGKKTLLKRLKVTETKKISIGEDFYISLCDKKTRLYRFDISAEILSKYGTILKKYWKGAVGLIFVLDSQDRVRFPEAKRVIDMLIQDESLQDAVKLIFANKQDADEIMDVATINKFLNLPTGLDAPPIKLLPCAASTEAGVYDGLDWLSRTAYRMQHNKSLDNDA